MGRKPLVVLSLAVLAVTHAAADDIVPAALGPRTVRFTYEARVTPPAGTRVAVAIRVILAVVLAGLGLWLLISGLVP